MRDLRRSAMSTDENGFKVDYVTIADAATMQPISKWDGKIALVALVAAYLNDVRLIDNILLQNLGPLLLTSCYFDPHYCNM